MSEAFNPRLPIELRQLRYFVTLAQELNFRRAAERLFITQPSLSHQIALLEASLGIRLFKRDRRQVVLTEAGQALLEDSRHLLTEADAILMKARRMGAVDSTILRIGFPEYANRTLIPEIIAAFRSRHPEARVTLSEGYSRTLLRELRDGVLDVGFVMMPAAEDAGELGFELVIDEKPGLLLSANHRLTACAEVPVDALTDEHVLLADRSVNPVIYDMVAGWLERAGVQPQFFKVSGSGVYTYDTALRLIESGEAVSLGAPSMIGELPAGVVFRPIRGAAPHFRVAAAWSPRNTSRLLADFLAAARELSSVEMRVPAIR
jgi:DNA-binding transcriptional LysR family regulator